MRRAARITVAAGALIFFSLPAFADDAPQSWRQLVTDWEFDPAVVIGLVLSAWLYWRGVRRLWKIVGAGNGIRRSEVACYAAGWFFTLVALISPLHPWGEALFSAHMVQHEILMLISAPLFVLGRPMIAFLKALPGDWAYNAARFGNSRPWQKFWRSISDPVFAWLIHLAVLWLWHIPLLFQAAVANDFVHSLQHTCFLFSALLFWWALIHGHRRVMGYGMSVLYVFTTALHTGALGAIITIANHPLYPIYSQTTQAWGLTPLEDQQLGGLIMWVPAGLVYIVAALYLFAAWLRESESRARIYESGLQQNPIPKSPNT